MPASIDSTRVEGRVADAGSGSANADGGDAAAAESSSWERQPAPVMMAGGGMDSRTRPPAIDLEAAQIAYAGSVEDGDGRSVETTGAVRRLSSAAILRSELGDTSLLGVGGGGWGGGGHGGVDQAAQGAPTTYHDGSSHAWEAHGIGSSRSSSSGFNFPDTGSHQGGAVGAGMMGKQRVPVGGAAVAVRTTDNPIHTAKEHSRRDTASLADSHGGRIMILTQKSGFSRNTFLQEFVLCALLPWSIPLYYRWKGRDFMKAQELWPLSLPTAIVQYLGPLLLSIAVTLYVSLGLNGMWSIEFLHAAVLHLTFSLSAAVKYASQAKLPRKIRPLEAYVFLPAFANDSRDPTDAALQWIHMAEAAADVRLHQARFKDWANRWGRRDAEMVKREIEPYVRSRGMIGWEGPAMSHTSWEKKPHSIIPLNAPVTKIVKSLDTIPLKEFLENPRLLLVAGFFRWGRLAAAPVASAFKRSLVQATCVALVPILAHVYYGEPAFGERTAWNTVVSVMVAMSAWISSLLQSQQNSADVLALSLVQYMEEYTASLLVGSAPSPGLKRQTVLSTIGNAQQSASASDLASWFAMKSVVRLLRQSTIGVVDGNSAGVLAIGLIGLLTLVWTTLLFPNQRDSLFVPALATLYVILMVRQCLQIVSRAVAVNRINKEEVTLLEMQRARTHLAMEVPNSPFGWQGGPELGGTRRAKTPRSSVVTPTPLPDSSRMASLATRHALTGTVLGVLTTQLKHAPLQILGIPAGAGLPRLLLGVMASGFSLFATQLIRNMDNPADINPFSG